MNQEKPNNVNLDIDTKVAEGTYSNLAIISHSSTEFVMDFAQIFPGGQNPVVRQRVILNPVHAKRLLAALADNVKKYENQYGTIRDIDQERNAERGGRMGTVPMDMLPKGNA